MKLRFVAFSALALLAVGCSSSSGAVKSGAADTSAEKQVVNDMHDTLLTGIQELHTAAVAIENAAPTPSGRGWDATQDKDALAAMTAAWIDARHAYERTEGAIAPLFPDVDAAIDARYDDFMGNPDIKNAGGDQDLFDGKGVTGMHAIERILYAPTTPPAIIAAEAVLPGYKAAAWPATEAEAAEFKSGLCTQLVGDVQGLMDQWTTQSIDVSLAYNGLIALMNEQREKVSLAASQEEESRYSQRTMVDIRDNLAGTKTVYQLFVPWLKGKSGGAGIDTDIESGFGKLDTDYSAIDGDAFPSVPPTWQAEKKTDQSAADLATPFGVLFVAVNGAVDPNTKGSVVDSMNQAAIALGLQPF